MLSLIEVKCPHCGARGQLTLPLIGAIIIGLCPECYELVALCWGRVLPLDNEIMRNGSFSETREHVANVLVAHVLKEAFSADEDEGCVAEEEIGGQSQSPRAGKSNEISEREVVDFARSDLDLIDNKDYFKAIFG